MPTTSDTGLKYETRSQATAVLALEQGSLSTEWHFRPDGTWRLHGLMCPRH